MRRVGYSMSTLNIVPYGLICFVNKYVHAGIPRYDSVEMIV